MFSAVSDTGRNTISSKWVHLEIVGSDGIERPISLWCAHNAEQGLALWWPLWLGMQAKDKPTDGFLSTLWVGEGILGLWIPTFAPRGFHAWTSTTKTPSVIEACDWGVQQLKVAYPEIAGRIEADSRARNLVGRTFDLEPFIGDDPWIRYAGGKSDGGVVQVNRIVANVSGWTVHLDGLDDIKYEMRVDSDLKLIDVERITASQ